MNNKLRIYERIRADAYRAALLEVLGRLQEIGEQYDYNDNESEMVASMAALVTELYDRTKR